MSEGQKVAFYNVNLSLIICKQNLTTCINFQFVNWGGIKMKTVKTVLSLEVPVGSGGLLVLEDESLLDLANSGRCASAGLWTLNRTPLC